MALFSNRIPNKSLAVLCRSLGTMLRSGVPLKRALKTSTNKAGSQSARNAMMRVREEIDSGSDVATAMRSQDGAFPELMTDMIDVAEQSGALPEVLNAMGDHYENLVRIKRDFIGMIIWPVIQLVAAVLLIAAMIFFLGMIATMTNTEAQDTLGWGLTGTKGAIIWLCFTFGSAFGLFVLYQVLSSSLSGKKSLDKFLMRIPVVGHCMRSFAIARFSWAFHLTQEAGMPIRDSMKASLAATGNGQFMAHKRQIVEDVMGGEQLSVAMQNSRLFPEDYIEMVIVGETSGTVPEMLHRMSPEFEASARRSLSALAATLGWAVWLLVAGFIIYIVITIMMWYINMIESFM